MGRCFALRRSCCFGPLPSDDHLAQPAAARKTATQPTADREFLRAHALRIWRYFYEFGGERHNYLIPDNVMEDGSA